MNFNYKKYTNRIIFFYIAIPLLIAIVLYFLLPTLLNYPPESINNQFQREFDGLTYSQQYVLLVFFVLIFSVIILFTRMNRLNHSIRMLNKPNISKEDTMKMIKNIRLLCLNTPYLLYYLEIFIPLVILPLTFTMVTAYFLTIIKICIIYISFFTLGAVMSFVSSQSEFKKIMISLHDAYPDLTDEIEEKYYKHHKFGKSLYTKLILQILPLVMMALVFTSLIGYTQASKKTGEIYYSSYKNLMDTTLLDNFETFYDIENSVSKVNLLDSSHIYFILNENGEYTTSDNSTLQPFFIKYTIEKSQLYNGRTYDYFCLDIEGIAKKIVSNDGNVYYAGFIYSTGQQNLLVFILISDFVLLLIIFITIIYITTSLSKEINIVTNNLNNIAKDNENKINLNTTLAITSEDELRDLVIAFNKVQKMTKYNLEQLQDNQDLLMEKERLASLGQLIGGIAHNLKTPIMSIAGAAEGLTDLVSEYDSSIGDPEVNDDDHHEIADDMSKWIEKIKTHTSYMSDIITAVKGQAVTLSKEEQDNFTLEELVKRVNILMKHELKNALVDLNIRIDTEPTISLNGNVNSLVQVINNMISNAIQSYNGEPNKYIDMILSKKDNDIIVSIQDYGCGMSSDVKDKLFKEMITTKGKNGTGLGLFMSYSTIRGHFNGNITFDSKEGEGTTFNIILPL